MKMLMYSRSQPCTVSDKLAPAHSIVGSYIYPGDETHTYLCMSVHTHTHIHTQTCTHAMQRSGGVERAALGWGSAEEGENEQSHSSL